MMIVNKIRVSARAIIIDNDKILLNEFGDGQYYNFIGGEIEENETAKQAVVREVMEESGLAVYHNFTSSIQETALNVRKYLNKNSSII